MLPVKTRQQLLAWRVSHVLTPSPNPLLAVTVVKLTVWSHARAAKGKKCDPFLPKSQNERLRVDCPEQHAALTCSFSFL